MCRPHFAIHTEIRLLMQTIEINLHDWGMGEKRKSIKSKFVSSVGKVAMRIFFPSCSNSNKNNNKYGARDNNIYFCKSQNSFRLFGA